jgi:hypothetical protein
VVLLLLLVIWSGSCLTRRTITPVLTKAPQQARRAPISSPTALTCVVDNGTNACFWIEVERKVYSIKGNLRHKWQAGIAPTKGVFHGRMGMESSHSFSHSGMAKFGPETNGLKLCRTTRTPINRNHAQSADSGLNIP